MVRVVSHPTQSTQSPQSPKSRPRSPLGTMDLQESPAPPFLSSGTSKAQCGSISSTSDPCVGWMGTAQAWEGSWSGRVSTAPTSGQLSSLSSTSPPSLLPTAWFPSLQTELPPPQAPKSETQAISSVFSLLYPQYRIVTPPDLSALPCKRLSAPCIPLCLHPHPQHRPRPSHHHLSAETRVDSRFPSPQAPRRQE